MLSTQNVDTPELDQSTRDMRLKMRRKESVILELEDWEAKQLLNLLRRIEQKKTISKSEFSLPEKITGRKLIMQLKELFPQTKES